MPIDGSWLSRPEPGVRPHPIGRLPQRLSNRRKIRTLHAVPVPCVATATLWRHNRAWVVAAACRLPTVALLSARWAQPCVRTDPDVQTYLMRPMMATRTGCEVSAGGAVTRPHHGCTTWSAGCSAPLGGWILATSASASAPNRAQSGWHGQRLVGRERLTARNRDMR